MDERATAREIKKHQEESPQEKNILAMAKAMDSGSGDIDVNAVLAGLGLGDGPMTGMSHAGGAGDEDRNIDIIFTRCRFPCLCLNSLNSGCVVVIFQK